MTTLQRTELKSHDIFVDNFAKAKSNVLKEARKRRIKEELLRATVLLEINLINIHHCTQNTVPHVIWRNKGS